MEVAISLKEGQMPNASCASIKIETHATEQTRSRDPAVNDTGWDAGTDLTLLVRTIVAERFGRPLEEIGPDTRLAVDLGLDSLDMIEIHIALEERLHLPLPQVAMPEEISIETVQHLTEFLAARLAQHIAERRAAR
jgi:acyl carrier protein